MLQFTWKAFTRTSAKPQKRLGLVVDDLLGLWLLAVWLHWLRRQIDVRKYLHTTYNRVHPAIQSIYMSSQMHRRKVLHLGRRYAYVQAYTNVHAHLHTCMTTHTPICTHVSSCMHVYIYIYMHA